MPTIRSVAAQSSAVVLDVLPYFRKTWAYATRWSVLPWTVFFVSLLILVPGIGDNGLWTDEAATITGADRTFGQWWKMVVHVDAVHGLYYLLMRPWIAAFGVSEFALRLPSTLALAAAAGCLTAMLRPWGGRFAAGAAGLLLTCLPGVNWLGSEARSMSLQVLVAVLTTWLFLTWCRTSRYRWGYVALGIVALGLSVLMWSLLLTHVAMAAVWYRDRWRQAAVNLAIQTVLTALLLWLAVAEKQQISWISREKAPLSEKVFHSQLFRSDDPFPTILLWFVAGLALVAVCAARERRILFICLLWIVLPTFLVVSTVWLGMDLYLPRYLAFAAPGAAATVGLGLKTIPSAWLRGILLSLLIAAMIPGIVQGRSGGPKGSMAFRDIAEFGDGTDQVLISGHAMLARGVLMAYPEHFRQSKDLLLRETPQDSGTLWGVNAPDDDELAAARAATGSILLLRDRYAAPGALVQGLESHCTMVSRLDHPWYDVTRWSCRAPVTTP